MHGFLSFLSLLLVLQTLSCSSADVAVEASVIAEDGIRRHLAKLASDEFMGRKPFTAGEEITVEYIKSELEKLGIEPGNNGSYFQDVAMVEIDGIPSDNLVVSKNGAKMRQLERAVDYVAVTERVEDHIDLKGSELVFCGYGIVDPLTGKNDYQGIDMTGKTAVVLINDPGFGGEDSTLYKGDIMTYYGRWTYKYEEAARQGCDAVLLIHETASAGYPWFVVRQGWTGANLVVASENGNQDRCAMQGWISLESAKDIFEDADLDLSMAIREARTSSFRPIAMGLEIALEIQNSIRSDVSKNVIGVIPGSEQPEEYIVYTAHWDHFGIGEPSGDDSIYNGAYDNATGCAMVLDIARAFAEAGKAPKRSVVFLFVTAEEQGLLGSEYYVKNPCFPLSRTVANLNVDGANPFGKMRDVTVVGYGQNELEDMLAVLAKEQGRYLLPESEPEKGYYFRSDHFCFAKAGVPALFAGGGYDHWEKGKEFALQQHQNYTKKAYHRPEDNYDPTWDLTGMVDDGQLLYDLGLKLADDTHLWPQWKLGSEFSR